MKLTLFNSFFFIFGDILFMFSIKCKAFIEPNATTKTIAMKIESFTAGILYYDALRTSYSRH